MEGKNYRTIGKDCQAVSEVYGTLLMISIVIIGFSGIALIVYSDGGIEKPEHVPHTDLCEIMNIHNNTVQIVHSGGDAIDLSAIKIIFRVNGQESAKPPFVSPFTVKNPDGSPSSDGVFTLGDCIEIDTTGLVTDSTSPTGVRDPTIEDMIEMFFVDIPSQQVIQKTVLHGNFAKLPYWFTPDPYGIIRDKSGNNTEIFQPTELTNEINDGPSTQCHIEKNLTSYETFTFGMDQYDLDLGDSLKKVFLKIVYADHDNSEKDLKLEINVGGPWITVAPNTTTNTTLGSYKDFSECDTKLAPFNITEHVNTPAKLYNLTVRFSATGNAASDNKNVWIDFIGIHIE